MAASADFTILGLRFPEVGSIIPPSRNPYLGGQNFTYCCLKAVNAFLQGNHSTAVSVAQPFSAQFPCGASFDGDHAGVSPVAVTYSWCHQECPGWAASGSVKLNQWLQPFVGFILPALVFCLTIPRRNKLSLPHFVFPAAIDGPITLSQTIIGFPTAGLIVGVDTIVWLFVTLALSGPMLLSGLYEAWIDKRILDFLETSVENHQLPLSFRARILFAILVGNLDVDSAWQPTMDLANNTDPPTDQVEKLTTGKMGGATQACEPLSNVVSRLTETVRSTALVKMAEMAAKDAVGESPPHWSDVRIPLEELVSHVDCVGAVEIAMEELTERQRLKRIFHVKGLLQSMLACQYSFGSSVGAAVIFYIGSFVYAVIEIKSALGDNDSAHAISFGMWWMIIPHISIISGCLLAGNNPNTLEGVAPQTYQETQQPEPESVWTSRWYHIKYMTHERWSPAYDSFYKTAWMWDRGKCKYDWLIRLCFEYHDCYPDHLQVNDKLQILREELHMTVWRWTAVSIPTFLLFFGPCVLSFLQAFWTPQIGISCRAMIFVVYAGAEMLLLLMRVREFSWGRLMAWRDNYLFRTLLGTVRAIGFAAAIFSAIGGTLMQMIGLYRNCLCAIAIPSWIHGKRDATLLLSTNNRIDIEQAELHWQNMGIAAAVFLAVNCYVGWWYQRRLRYRFKEMVERLDTNLPRVDPS